MFSLLFLALEVEGEVPEGQVQEGEVVYIKISAIVYCLVESNL